MNHTHFKNPKNPMPRFFLIGLLLFAAGCSSSTVENRILPTLAQLPTATPTPAELRFWEAVSGTFNAPGESAQWQFSGKAGDNIRLRVVSDATANLTLTTLAGTRIAHGEDIEARLPNDATYIVKLQLDRPESYELGLSYSDRPNPNAPPTATSVPVVVGIPTPTPPYTTLGTYIGNLIPGAKQSGTLSSTTPVHVYTFNGTPGMVITLIMQPIAGDIDPVLTLYDPQTKPLATDDNSGGGKTARLRNILLPAEGLYSFQAAGDNLPGDYEIALIAGIQPIEPDPILLPTATPTQPYATPTIGFLPTGGRLHSHVPVTGNIARGSDFQRFSFAGTAGDTASIIVRPAAGTGLRPMVELFNPSGEIIATGQSTTSNADGAALITAAPLNETGIYFLIVTSEGGTSGGFSLAYGSGASHTDQFRGIIPAEQRTEGSILQPGLRDVWQIALNAGDAITIAARPGSGRLDPVVELAAPDGTVLAKDDNSGDNNAALLRYVAIQTSGIYLIKVHDAAGVNQGVYTLLWRYVRAAPTATPVPASVTIAAISDTVAENDYRFYTFQAQQGQRIRIQVRAANSTLDPVAVLIAPDGTVIAEGDDSGTTLNPDFTALLPDDGTYTVRVNGYLSGGNFELVVALLL